MFYHACKTGGCKKKFAAILYIGVSIGSWASTLKLKSSQLKSGEDKQSKIDTMIIEKYNEVSAISEKTLKTIGIDELEKLVDEKLEVQKQTILNFEMLENYKEEYER